MRLPHQWGGIHMVKFTAAPGGPYMEYVGDQVCLSPGWTPKKLLVTYGRRVMRPPLPPMLTVFFPVTAPLWVWSLEGKAWMFVIITYAINVAIRAPCILLAVVAMNRALKKRRQIDNAMANLKGNNEASSTWSTTALPVQALPVIEGLAGTTQEDICVNESQAAHQMDTTRLQSSSIERERDASPETKAGVEKDSGFRVEGADVNASAGMDLVGSSLKESRPRKLSL